MTEQQSCWSCRVIDLGQGLLFRFRSSKTGAFMLLELRYALLTNDHKELLEELSQEEHTYQELCELVGMLSQDCEFSSEGYQRQQVAIKEARGNATGLASDASITINSDTRSNGKWFYPQYIPKNGRKKSFKRFKCRNKAECFRMLLVAELMKRNGQPDRARQCLEAAAAFSEIDPEWTEEVQAMDLTFVKLKRPSLRRPAATGRYAA